MQINSEIWCVKNLLSELQVSRSTLYAKLLKDPDFPRPFKIGARKNVWFRRDVESWLNARANEVSK